MAQSDVELISEVRSLTDYHEGIISDSDMQDLVVVAKEEVRGELGDSSFEFYGAQTFDADRALFWFLCIASKVKVGELGGIEITADAFRSQQPQHVQNSFWFIRFQNKMQAAALQAGTGGAATTTISRSDERSYEYDRPE